LTAAQTTGGDHWLANLLFSDLAVQIDTNF
jgi:hypothetical protein